jgi:Tol biopolymer transport system component
MHLALSILVLVPAAFAAPQESAEPPSFADARLVLWESGVKNAYPRWSTDRRRILYQSDRGGKWRLLVMGADGSEPRALTPADSNSNFPDWSPDGEHIAFVSDRDGNEEVYVMALDGSGLANLSCDAGRDIHPYWAPDGRSLLFNSTRAVGRFQIYEVQVDGSGLRRLVESPDDDTCARIAPGGERFVYLANLAAGRDDVLLRKRDGSEPEPVTSDAARDGWPAWAPDGRVVYSSDRSGTFSLYVRELESGAELQLTTPKAPWADGRASVSADGRQVVFNRQSGETIGICVVDLPAAGPRKPAKQG